MHARLLLTKKYVCMYVCKVILDSGLQNGLCNPFGFQEKAGKQKKICLYTRICSSCELSKTLISTYTSPVEMETTQEKKALNFPTLIYFANYFLYIFLGFLSKQTKQPQNNQQTKQLNEKKKKKQSQRKTQREREMRESSTSLRSSMRLK